MAEIIDSDIESQTISPSYSLWRIIVLGVLSGLLFWVLTIAINQYIINPIFCGSNSTAYSCLKATNIPGNIAAVLVAVAGIVAMVYSRIAQPLITTVATGATLWGLAQWTSGLPTAEIIIWSVIVYTLSYLLFSWINRYTKALPISIMIFAVIIAARIIVNL
jgi:hypothetical protein